MIVHYLFHVHPDQKEKAKEEMRKLRTVIQKPGGRNLKHYASMMSGTPNRLFIYEIDKLAYFDSLNADPDFRNIKLDSLYTNATGTTWGRGFAIGRSARTEMPVQRLRLGPRKRQCGVQTQ